MNQSPQFNREADLKSALPNEIKTFWLQGHFDSFSGVADTPIHYGQFTQERTDAKALVIAPGRCESYLKYQELAYDLYQQGYSVFIIDHRGQGLSGRLLDNLHKGYVVKFQDYVDDFQHFIESIVTPHCSAKPYILAHSMGGAIATRYMQDSPSAIQAAVITSPMLGLDTGNIPRVIAETVMNIMLRFNKLLSHIPWYFLGQKDYRPKRFYDNKLTHSSSRYQLFVNLYKENKKIQLGGVTTHWLAEAIAAQKEIFTKISQLKTPILLLQAGADSIVCQQAQNDFCQQLNALQPQSCPNGEPIKIDGAYHELFFETDAYRSSALTQSIAWFKLHK